MDALAKHLGKERIIVSHTLQLALLSPESSTWRILGTLPKGITVKTFRSALPADWEEQKKMLGIEQGEKPVQFSAEKISKFLLSVIDFRSFK